MIVCQAGYLSRTYVDQAPFPANAVARFSKCSTSSNRGPQSGKLFSADVLLSATHYDADQIYRDAETSISPVHHESEYQQVRVALNNAHLNFPARSTRGKIWRFINAAGVAAHANR